ncbi:LPD7 domain-containing protein [Xanthomonas albilineans]|uniref:LPD7 domain-containing protein n=1 Tax=Xanthomonas albilineans TaxID=29447 RepID=UPI0005F3479B|nr:LPD7 domain-containing protein [Xanthomonas albilineans]
MAEPAFNENGAFNINGQWATGLRYEVKLDGGSFAGGTIKFINGRKQVASAKIASREEAVEIIGERNVENIEAGKGKEKDATPGTAKGKLQAENLSFKQSYTTDKKPVNEIEATIERDTSLDKDVQAFLAKRREEMARSRQQRLQNERIVSTEERGDYGADTKTATTEATPGISQSVEDRAKAVPDAVKQRFIQVDNKFHFPDKTLAFEDHGRKLATRSENQEVVRSVVAIAHARGWERIAVRGTEEFRRAAWLEASLTGIEVSGYKPTKVEKAHLATLLERQGGIRENSIEEREPRERETGSTRPEQSPAASTAPAGSKRTLTPDVDHEAAAETPSDRHGTAAGVKLRDGVIAGQLLEHGEANYKHDPKKEKSYYVKVQTERGERTVWGVDLCRAVDESGAAIGDRVAIEKVGSKSVTAKERVFDKDGNEVGERAVDAHRNRWQVGSLEKAEAFTRYDRAEVVKKHPDLAPAYGTVAAAQKFAEKQFANKEDQARFVSIARQVVAEKIAHGENVPAPKIREAKVQGRPKDQGKDQDRSGPPKPREANQEFAR